MLDPESLLKKKKLILTLSVAFIGLTLTAIILGDSLNVGSLGSSTITEEEVIEISRSSPTVQEFLQRSDWYTVYATHYNQTQIVELKENRVKLGLSPDYESLATDHGAWKVSWLIHPEGAPSAVEYLITQWIDEESGQILDEGLLASR